MGCLCQEIAGPDIELSPICLGQLWMFENLPQPEVDELLCEADRKKWAKGDQLFMQSDPAEELFLIKGGRIKLVKVLNDGSELTLDIRKAGDFLGENVFLHQDNYPVNAICLEDTLICGFSKSQFEQLVLKKPGIGLQVIKNMSERISSLTNRVTNLSATSIDDRLYSVLCSVANDHGANSPRGIVIQFPLTQKELSFLTGAHHVSITKAMKSLKRAGKIIQEDNELTLTAMAS